MMRIYQAVLGLVVHGILANASRLPVLEPRDCTHNNCLRQLIAAPSAAAFCATYTTTTNTASTGLPTYVSQCSSVPSKISSACSCLATTAQAITSTKSSSSSSTTTPPSIVSDTTIFRAHSTAGFKTSIVPTTSVDLGLGLSRNGPPTQTALPMRIGPLDATNNTLDSIKAGLTKQVLAGASNADGTYVLILMQYTAATGTELINLEDFQPFISSVACGASSPPTTIAVTFNSAAGYGTASASWAVGYGIITSGASLCGAADTRSFYQISLITLSPNTNTITLTVASVDPGDVASSMTGDFSTLAPGKTSPIAPTVGTAVANAWDAIEYWFASPHMKKRVNDQSTSFSISVSDFADFFDTLAGDLGFASGADVSVACPGCGLYGTVTLSGGWNFDWNNAHPFFYAGADISGLDVVIDFNVAIPVDLSFSGQMTIATLELPGLSIPDILTLGPAVNLVGELSFDATGNVMIDNLGFTVTMPDSSWSVNSESGSSQVGWNPVYTPLTPSISVSDLDLTLEAYIAPQIALEIALSFGPLINYGWTIDVTMKFPDLVADLKYVNAQSNDQCYDPTKEISFSGTLDLEMDIYSEITGDFIGDNIFTIYNPTLGQWPFCYQI